MTNIRSPAEGRQIEHYIRSLEAANSKLAQENAQLRVSHSYRLGLAFVSFAKRRSPRMLPTLLREVREAMRPALAPVLRRPKRPIGLFPGTTFGTADALQQAMRLPPVGTMLALHTRGQPTRVAGIFSDAVAVRLGFTAVRRTLPFDSYDAAWRAENATHLVFEVDRLRDAAGWEHALTLRDVSATVEFAVMLQKAREVGLHTIVLRPSEPHAFPLLGRVLPFVEHVIDVNDLSPDSL